jgi:hypothetical protein
MLSLASTWHGELVVAARFRFLSKGLLLPWQQITTVGCRGAHKNQQQQEQQEQEQQLVQWGTIRQLESAAAAVWRVLGMVRVAAGLEWLGSLRLKMGSWWAAALVAVQQAVPVALRCSDARIGAHINLNEHQQQHLQQHNEAVA